MRVSQDEKETELHQSFQMTWRPESREDHLCPSAQKYKIPKTIFTWLSIDPVVLSAL